ncbi:hypothetical protein MAPG_10640 [Magnaporthiopsis poae ATCC 64411]|uniref:Uncharacterized protein n=1 Tax=Magnaporthiopsis poae (strain ATCC 64411 / 73-15) TaxID=644358 RepID=A0A0C4ED47_MAGP6|nr:hypothetical protein MAPG_10640 [Magnaporthiopsis poae ATCC 64411]
MSPSDKHQPTKIPTNQPASRLRLSNMLLVIGITIAFLALTVASTVYHWNGLRKRTTARRWPYDLGDKKVMAAELLIVASVIIATVQSAFRISESDSLQVPASRLAFAASVAAQASRCFRLWKAHVDAGLGYSAAGAVLLSVISCSIFPLAAAPAPVSGIVGASTSFLEFQMRIDVHDVMGSNCVLRKRQPRRGGLSADIPELLHCGGLLVYDLLVELGSAGHERGSLGPRTSHGAAYITRASRAGGEWYKMKWKADTSSM